MVHVTNRVGAGLVLYKDCRRSMWRHKDSVLRKTFLTNFMHIKCVK